MQLGKTYSRSSMRIEMLSATGQCLIKHAQMMGPVSRQHERGRERHGDASQPQDATFPRSEESIFAGLNGRLISRVIKTLQAPVPQRRPLPHPGAAAVS